MSEGERIASSFKLVRQILESPDKWPIFEQNKDRLSSKVCQILRPAIELDRKLTGERETLMGNLQQLTKYIDIFKNHNVTFGSIQNQRNQIRRAILEFVDELSQNGDTERKSTEVINALKDHLQETIVKPSVENACEREMNAKDQDLIAGFNTISHIYSERTKETNATSMITCQRIQPRKKKKFIVYRLYIWTLNK